MVGAQGCQSIRRQSLQEAFGEAFKDELHRYGRALSQWVSTQRAGFRLS